MVYFTKEMAKRNKKKSTSKAIPKPTTSALPTWVSNTRLHLLIIFLLKVEMIDLVTAEMQGMTEEEKINYRQTVLLNKNGTNKSLTSSSSNSSSSQVLPHQPSQIGTTSESITSSLLSASRTPTDNFTDRLPAERVQF